MKAILKTLARWGAVGGTARWGAKLYNVMAEQVDRVEPEELCNLAIFSRYGVGDSKDGLVLKRLSVEGEITSLCHLVVLILTVEAGFAENAPNMQVEFVGVIAAELKSRSVPDALAFGDDPYSDMDTLWWRYHPSIQRAHRMMLGIEPLFDDSG